MHLRPRLAPLVIMVSALLVLIFLKPLWQAGGVIIVRNLSPSMPLGFYLVHKSRDLEKGNIAVFHIPRNKLKGHGVIKWFSNASYLIKPVAGVKGDFICSRSQKLFINGSMKAYSIAKDRNGSPLSLFHGCFRVKKGWFLPLSTKIKNSYDGRYFGALPKHLLIGIATPILTWD